jgi:hypothetical protein
VHKKIPSLAFRLFHAGNLLATAENLHLINLIEVKSASFHREQFVSLLQQYEVGAGEKIHYWL